MALNLPIVSKFDSKGVDQADSALSKLGGVASGIGIAAGAAFAAASAAAIAFGASSLKAAAEAEAINRVMENAVKNSGLFGDAAGIKNATKALDEHSTKLAEVTGIDDELLNSQKAHWMAIPALAAMGTEGINNLAKVTADVAAGTGKDVEAIGNMFIKTAGDSETAMSKLMRAGVVLSDSQKQTYNDMVKLGDEAGAQAYLIDQLGTMYAGSAQAAANPFKQLQIIFENLQETVGGAMLPAVQKLVPVIAQFVTNLTASPAFLQFMDALALTFSQLTTALMPLLQPFMDLIMILLPPLMGIIQALVPVVIALVNAMMPMVSALLPPLIALIDALLPVFMQLFKTVIEPLIPIVVRLVEAFVPLIIAVLPPLMRIINAIIPVVFALLNAFMPLIETLLPPLIDLFMKVQEPLINMLEKVLPYLTPLIKGFGDMLKWLVDTIVKPAIDMISGLVGWFEKLLGMDGKKVNVTATTTGQRLNYDGSRDYDGDPTNAFALGGIVTSPTKALIGEAGAEAVIPLDRLGEMTGLGRNNNGGGNQINITVHAGMGADGAALGEQIVTAIRKYERTSGAVFARA